MSPMQWAGIFFCAWVPSVAGFCSSWLPCRTTSMAPTQSSSMFGYKIHEHDRHTHAQAQPYQTVAGKRLTLACSLDNLRTVQRKNGGVVGDVSFEDGHVSENVLLSGFEAGLGIRQRVDAVEQAVASSTLLADKSHWGIIRVQGEDRLRFLHSQGTNAFEGAAKGSVVPTCFTSNVGRVVDFCEGVVLDDEVWLLSSPHRWQRLLQSMDKFIFPMDKTTVSSLTDDMAVFSLTGPGAIDSLCGANCDAKPSPGQSVEWEFEGEKVVVICHKRPMTTRSAAEDVAGAASGGVQGVGEAYYTLFMPASVSAKLWSILSALPSVVAAGVEEWQTLRIKQGFPMPGKELTNDYNPLEAGLWHSVHFDKGCYIGQEAISRVNAYNAVKTGLYGVVFEDADVAEGAELVSEETGKRAGVVTSMTDPGAASCPLGLAYIRTQAGGIGLKVATKDGVRGTVVQVPYPTRSDAESAMPPVKKDEGKEAEVATTSNLKEEKAKEAARKAAKLEAMQKKLDALKARRGTAS